MLLNHTETNLQTPEKIEAWERELFEKREMGPAMAQWGQLAELSCAAASQPTVNQRKERAKRLQLR